MHNNHIVAGCQWRQTSINADRP